MKSTISIISILILSLLPVIASLETDLIRAVGKGDLQSVTSLLQEGVNPKAEDSDAFVYAVEMGHVEIAKILLENGADPNAQNSKALVAASTGFRASPEMVQLLLENGADFKAQNSKAFVEAISNGNSEIIKTFFEYGINDEIADKLYNDGNKKMAADIDKEYLIAKPDSIDYVIAKWIDRGEEGIAMTLKNNPKVAIYILDKLIRNGKFTEAEEYGNKVLEYWVSQSDRDIQQELDLKLKFAINMNADYYYAMLNEKANIVDPVLGNYSQALANLPLNEKMKDLSITDFLVHRSYVNQDFLNNHNVSLEDARKMLEVDIYELVKKNDLIFSILHTVALNLKEDPYYKLHIFDKEPLGEILGSPSRGLFIEPLGTLHLAAMPLRSAILRQTLVHEFTHLLMKFLFHNNSKPFSKNDDKAKIAWDTVKETILEKLNNIPEEFRSVSRFSPNINPYEQTLIIYNDVKRLYGESEYDSEFIARFPEIVASEAYEDPQVQEFLKPIYDYWMQFIKPAIEKNVKERAAIDTFVSDWERENISDPFFRSKFNK